MKSIYYLILLLSLTTLLGCSNDSQSDLVEEQNPGTSITYSNTIQSIINNNCVGCHSNPPQNGAPFPLANFDEVFTRANNGQLLRSISRQTGEPRAMPPSGRLPQATIDLVEQWIEQGIKEN
ncbi:hypothetical protein EYD45_07305 [Hyunsoonleella flava]|uniref:Cytochrome c domain-containing protein n=1 Tax=Hyunsoonleella flava TaxID=2527939 RepID=A0A4Q9FJQ4_9FLAO|nr:hypothetical protein [Hyunsoonleella flava]TBN04416.1 hypothetical protein EYD45_07305 [Hyunsoonleella flava]